jgi:hypothetical protein
MSLVNCLMPATLNPLVILMGVIDFGSAWATIPGGRKFSWFGLGDL